MDQTQKDSGDELSASEPLSDHQFEYLVDQDLNRRNNFRVRTFLERPENLSRWREVLSQKYAFTGSLIASLKAEKLTVQQACLEKGKAGYKDWITHKAEADRKIAATTHFLAVVQSRLVHIKALREQEHARLQREHQRIKDENITPSLPVQATSKTGSYEDGYQEGFRKGFRQGYGRGWDDAQTKVEPDVPAIRQWIEDHLGKRRKEG